MAGAGGFFQPTAWSPDGRQLAGVLVSESGRQLGIATYDFATHTLRLVASEEAWAARWLADSRRVVYLSGATLVVVDTVTRARKVVDVRLPGQTTSEVFAISPDNRTIYYGASRAEADIWIVERR
jgi:hypothetical protein